ncbi:unnamed protein product [Lactuca virosa]|uniref:Uncharacterized protein n=1 Tax=Lactuca virosa TaxID=75947 RepID=A0AAU9PCP8_9ASTR|nr:unnamed protein product [Lactuca virosa]
MHRRKPIRDKQRAFKQQPHHRIIPPLPPPRVNTGTRDHRSYAQEMGIQKETQLVSEPPIRLNSNTQMKEWLKKKTLIGEAHSLDHISNLPASLLRNDDTKYLGGLTIALGFSNSMDAREFLEDNNRWNEWFKWLMLADQEERPYERTAWLKILGLLLRLFDEENFSKIAGRFGKVISPFDKIRTRRGYSMGKVGVITSQRKWINEEISIMADGKYYKLGVVEYTDDCSPFHPLPFDKVVEDSDEDEIGSSEEESDDEGVLETWIGENTEAEEGEIVHPTQPVRRQEDDNDIQVTGNSNHDCLKTISPAVLGDEPEINDFINSCNATSTLPINMESVEILKNKNVEVLGFDPCVAEDSFNGTIMNDKITDDQRDGWTLNTSFGPSQNMVHFGCFGSFPNPFQATKTKLAQIRPLRNLSNNSRSPNIYSPTTKKRKNTPPT